MPSTEVAIAAVVDKSAWLVLGVSHADHVVPDCPVTMPESGFRDAAAIWYACESMDNYFERNV